MLSKAKRKQQLGTWNGWNATVGGRNPAPVDGKYHIIYRVLYIIHPR